MRFSFEGKEYVLEFSYDRKRVQTHSGSVIVSRDPYTTASILVVDPTNKNMDEWEVYKKAEAGVLKGDRFDKEMGRMYALRKLMPKVPKGMRALIWGAYHSRPEKRVKSAAQLRKLNTRLRHQLQAALEQGKKWHNMYTSVLNETNET